MKINEKKLLDFIEKNKLENFKIGGLISGLHYRTILINGKTKKYDFLENDKNNEIIGDLIQSELNDIRTELNRRKYDF